jgi:heme-degrading monooxygenase HmoA
MFARIATFEGVDIAAAERTLDAAYERLEPLFRGMQGWQGVLDLVDRSSGKAVTMTLFESEEDMQAAEPTFEEEMPRQLGDLIQEWSRRRTSVERFEVVYERRAGT